MDQRRSAPATARNRDPILAVLRRALGPGDVVLEVASGSGEHAAYFASQLPGTTWQPSDRDPDCIASIDAWCAASPGGNVQPAITLDVAAPQWPLDTFDAMFSANMVHISPWTSTLGLLRGAGAHLRRGGGLFLYGPYRVGGEHTAPSNAAFDASLRARDPSWGVRDLEAVVEEAAVHGLALAERVEMPANNFVLIFRA